MQVGIQRLEQVQGFRNGGGVDQETEVDISVRQAGLAHHNQTVSDRIQVQRYPLQRDVVLLTPGFGRITGGAFGADELMHPVGQNRQLGRLVGRVCRGGQAGGGERRRTVQYAARVMASMTSSLCLAQSLLR